MYWRSSLTLAALAFALTPLACGDQPMGPDVEQDLVAEAGAPPMSNYINGPENPGESGVNRLEFGGCFWCQSTDPALRLYVAHFQADDIFWCGGSSDYATWQATMVGNESGEVWNQSHGDFPIFIYDLDAWRAARQAGTLCTFFAEEWLYQGTHVQTAVDKSQDNGTFFQMKAHGTVYDPDGNRYQYSEHQKFVVGVGWTHEEIRIH